MRRALPALFLLGSFASLGHGAVYLDPSLTFRTIETRHFLIHFHQGEEEIAGRLAVIAEDVHERLSPIARWSPRSRTQVLLLDISDEANGMATPFPYNAVVILVSQPGPEESISFYNDWLALVFTHEYSHVLHLDHTEGFSSVLQHIFGRLYFPNLFQPLWLIEGYAVHQETARTGAGRGAGSLFDMMIRTAYLEGKLNAMDQGDGALALWPGGEFPYLYGMMLYQFISERYGEDKIAQLISESASLPLPFFLNHAPRQVLGENYSSLWWDWMNSLGDKYRRQIESIKERPLTQARRLTFTGYHTRGPVYSPGGQTILYSHRGPAEYPSLRVISRDGKGDRTLSDRNDGMYSSWSRDGKRIVFSQSETYRSFSLYSDLYVLGFGDGNHSAERMTHGMRLGYPDMSPDGSDVACVKEGLGKTELGIYSPDSRTFTPLITGDDYTRFSSPRWSPDGSRIVFSAFRPGGWREILVLDRTTGSIFTVTGSRHWNLFPTWSPDGQVIVYSSDRTGVSNLYACSVTTGQTRQITNVTGGAFESGISSDGREIAFTGYSAEGFDIYTLDFDPTKGWETATLIEPFTRASSTEEPLGESRPYSPWTTVLPRFWLPIADYSTQNGTSLMALTAGADIVARHLYLLAGLYRFTVNRAGGYLMYENDVLRPSIVTQAQVLPSPAYTFTSPTGDVVTHWETDSGGSLDLSFPILFFRSSHKLSIGYSYHAISSVDPAPGYLLNPPEDGRFAGLTAGYAYSNALRFPLSISQEDGRSFFLSYEVLSRGLGGDFDTQRIIADFREYVSIPIAAPRHVLGVRVAGGAGWGQVLNRRAFHMGGEGREEALLGIEDKDLFLRGYPFGFFRGQRALLVSTEYRFPFINIQRGWWTWPIFWRNTSFSVFFDAGDAWDGNAVSPKDFRKGIGAEFKMDTTILYALPITLTFGYAKGLDSGGIGEGYVTIGSAF